MIQTTVILRTEIDDNVSGDSFDGATNVADGAWRLAAITADRDANGTIYVDGIVDGTPRALTATQSIDDTTKDFVIGIDSIDETLNPFKGYIAPPRSIKRLLSAGEVLNYFNGTKHLFGR